MASPAPTPPKKIKTNTGKLTLKHPFYLNTQFLSLAFQTLLIDSEFLSQHPTLSPPAPPPYVPSSQHTHSSFAKVILSSFLKLLFHVCTCMTLRMPILSTHLPSPIPTNAYSSFLTQLKHYLL